MTLRRLRISAAGEIPFVQQLTKAAGAQGVAIALGPAASGSNIGDELGQQIARSSFSSTVSSSR